MGTINFTPPQDGQTIDAADVVTPLNTIYNEFNGNIDNANIKTAAAISGSKLADASIDLGAKGSVFDGWIPVSDSWAYASATTITVPTDATTKYTVGDKIKLVQSATTKYFYITAVASTVLTVNGGTDYTVANSAISGIYYSKSETPLGFPASFTYAPTLGNLSGGTQTYADFTMIGSIVHFRFKYTLGGAGVAGAVTLSLPVALNADYATSDSVNAVVKFLDANGSQYPGGTIKNAGGGLTVLAVNAAGTYALFNNISSTVPFTWASTDTIEVHGVYQVA